MEVSRRDLIASAKGEADSLREVKAPDEQLVGRIESLRISGLMAEVVLSVCGQQITSIITSRSAREMQLRRGQTVAALIKSTEVMILRL
jgi:molybdopterin-binding protein